MGYFANIGLQALGNAVGPGQLSYNPDTHQFMDEKGQVYHPSIIARALSPQAADIYNYQNTGAALAQAQNATQQQLLDANAQRQLARQRAGIESTVNGMDPSLNPWSSYFKNQQGQNSLLVGQVGKSPDQMAHEQMVRSLMNDKLSAPVLAGDTEAAGQLSSGLVGQRGSSGIQAGVLGNQNAINRQLNVEPVKQDYESAMYGNEAWNQQHTVPMTNLRNNMLVAGALRNTPTDVNTQGLQSANGLIGAGLENSRLLFEKNQQPVNFGTQAMINTHNNYDAAHAADTTAMTPLQVSYDENGNLIPSGGHVTPGVRTQQGIASELMSSQLNGAPSVVNTGPDGKPFPSGAAYPAPPSKGPQPVAPRTVTPQIMNPNATIEDVQNHLEDRHEAAQAALEAQKAELKQKKAEHDAMLARIEQRQKELKANHGASRAGIVGNTALNTLYDVGTGGQPMRDLGSAAGDALIGTPYKYWTESPY